MTGVDVDGVIVSMGVDVLGVLGGVKVSAGVDVLGTLVDTTVVVSAIYKAITYLNHGSLII